MGVNEALFLVGGEGGVFFLVSGIGWEKYFVRVRVDVLFDKAH